MWRRILVFLSGIVIGIFLGYAAFCEFNVDGAEPGYVVVRNLNHEHAMQMIKLIEDITKERMKNE